MTSPRNCRAKICVRPIELRLKSGTVRRIKGALPARLARGASQLEPLISAPLRRASAMAGLDDVDGVNISSLVPIAPIAARARSPSEVIGGSHTQYELVFALHNRTAGRVAQQLLVVYEGAQNHVRRVQVAQICVEPNIANSCAQRIGR